MATYRLTVEINTEEDSSQVLDDLQQWANEYTQDMCEGLVTDTACVDTDVQSKPSQPSANVSFSLEESDYHGILEMAGYGITYWANSMDTKEDLSCHIWDYHKGKEHVVTHKSVEKACLDLFVNAPLNDYYQSAITQLVARGCAGDVGSDIADAIIQQACFGKVIYG